MQALIVDDSKTARVSLRKMLDKHQISSAQVECAEDALEYLRDHQPGVIFMDHMMPGMDGFDAVKAIKADPEKASIPIVMYTTKRGDIYVGQARALGAADILSKPASDKALVEVLNRLSQSGAYTPATVTQPVAAVTADITEHTQPSVHSIPVAAPQIPAARVAGKTGGEPNTVFTDRVQEPSFFSVSLRQFIMLLIWLAPIIWLLILYLPAHEQRNQLLAERKALYKTIEWSINQSQSYDYGEAPMAAQRLETLRGLVSHLAVSGFKGTIRLEGHVGEFCLTEIALDEGAVVNMLPSAELPLSQCTSIGTSAVKAMQLSGQQSEAFKQFVSASPLLESSGIKVEIVRYGASYPKYEYPQILENTTVGDWNAVALSNSRVNFVLLRQD